MVGKAVLLLVLYEVIHVGGQLGQRVQDSWTPLSGPLGVRRVPGRLGSARTSNRSVYISLSSWAVTGQSDMAAGFPRSASEWSFMTQLRVL